MFESPKRRKVFLWIYFKNKLRFGNLYHFEELSKRRIKKPTTEEIAYICEVVNVYTCLLHKGRRRWGCKHSREYKLLKRNPWNEAKKRREKQWWANKCGIIAIPLFAICTYYLNKHESHVVLDEIKFRYYPVLVCWHKAITILLRWVWFERWYLILHRGHTATTRKAIGFLYK